MQVLEGVVGHFGGFGELWRLWGGLEVVQRQVLEPMLRLGVHTMIHGHIQAVSPHLLLPGQFHHPAWRGSSVFPAGMSRTGACGVSALLRAWK